MMNSFKTLSKKLNRPSTMRTRREQEKLCVCFGGIMNFVDVVSLLTAPVLLWLRAGGGLYVIVVWYSDCDILEESVALVMGINCLC